VIVCKELPLDREDLTTIMETLFDLRVRADRILELLEWEMAKRKRKKPTWTREDRERGERVLRQLQERIAYHRAKLAEERGESRP
jgi:hypothetical protein